MQVPCGVQNSSPEVQSVLIVDDEVLIRLMIADDLIGAGFRVFQAANAEDALKVLQSPVKIDLLLTDIRMPGRFDGLELVRRARASRPELKVILLSAEYEAGLADVEADAFLSKPYLSNDLIDCIRAVQGKPNGES